MKRICMLCGTITADPVCPNKAHADREPTKPMGIGCIPANEATR